jgi:hypothetical protein
MIQLHPDYLIFRTSNGELIPCSAESVTIELIGDAASILAAVVHFFKEELGRETVSVSEFTAALERALKMFGYDVVTCAQERGTRPAGIDLGELAAAGNDFELAFFKNVREEFFRQAAQAPEVITFFGLRNCVKRLVGTKRWSHRCELLSDQIVSYLRECLSLHYPTRGLVVR